MTDTFLKKLDEGLTALSLCLSDKQKELLYRYYQLVIEKNKVMNLTAITEETEFVQKHIVDSLALVYVGDAVVNLLSGEHRLIDVGTGAGLPGMVLKICFPEIRMTLFDSLKKRLRFLDEVIEELSLTGIDTLHGRAEDIGQNPIHRESYDLVMSRAVANLSTLSEYCLPLVKKDGIFLSYKSGEIEEERETALHPIRILGGSLQDTVSYLLPGTEMGRSLLLIQKTGKTPKQYPRKAGTPAKDPLK